MSHVKGQGLSWRIWHGVSISTDAHCWMPSSLVFPRHPYLLPGVMPEIPKVSKTGRIPRVGTFLVRMPGECLVCFMPLWQVHKAAGDYILIAMPIPPRLRDLCSDVYQLIEYYVWNNFNITLLLYKYSMPYVRGKQLRPIIEWSIFTARHVEHNPPPAAHHIITFTESTGH